MKKWFLVIGIIATTVITSCNKERMCRCSVRHQQDIRLIEIKRGNCEDIRFVYYDRDVLHTDLVDSVLCTDHEF